VNDGPKAKSEPTWRLITDWTAFDIVSRSYEPPFLHVTVKVGDSYESMLIPLSRVRYIKLGEDMIAKEIGATFAKKG
jgi:hypothetical protein